VPCFRSSSIPSLEQCGHALTAASQRSRFFRRAVQALHSPTKVLSEPKNSGFQSVLGAAATAKSMRSRTSASLCLAKSSSAYAVS
jgi:hypothetical protein